MSNTLKFGNGNWATKEGSTLAYNDENNNFKPLPFSFERDSSATVVNKDGLIETVGAGMPRIDYKDNSEGALLLEPQRTNLITQSEAFDNSYWTKSGASVTSGFVSPDGTNNAFKLVENTSNSAHRIFNGSGLSVSGNVSMSVFAKKGGRNFIRLTNNNIAGAFFDLNNGVVLGVSSGVTAKIEDFSNDWYRCSITQTGVANERLIVYLSNNGIDTTYQGDGASGVYIYGAQLEEGSYATSYIPTSGSTVTRLAGLSDTENLSHVIGQTEGVIFYDGILVHKSTSTAEDLFELSIDDGSDDNAFFINNYNNSLTIILKSGGSNSFFNNSFNPTEGAKYKLAFAYKENDFALYINGNQIATGSSGTAPAMNQITFGNYFDNRVNFRNSAKINDFRLYNTRLSNSELQALTS